MSQTKKFLIQVTLAIVIIMIGVVGFNRLKAEKKGIEKQAPEAPMPIVRTMTVSTGSMQMIVNGQGTVTPAREIQLVPQVSGKVIEVASDLVNGGIFKKETLLLVIEPADYEIAVTLAEARVKEAESLYKLAVEESSAAADEWQRHNPGKPPPPLVVKEPQLAAARALLEAEQSNLKKARLNLDRTRLRAPFNGRVVSENIDIGQYVSPGQSLATLHSTDAAEIVIPLEDEDLFWFDIPGFTTGSPAGASAEVAAEVAGRTIRWPGQVVRSEGRINELSRMLNIVVQVENPYQSLPPLVAGQFVEIDIYGRTIDNAAVIPRSALRDGGRIAWVVNPDDSRLHFRRVEVARSTRDGVVIKNGLADNDLVVVSSLEAVSDGMKVRFVEYSGGES